MNQRSDEWTERRDQALRDLVDLERQVEAGELTPQVAHDLRQRYEATAAAALAAVAARGTDSASGAHDPPHSEASPGAGPTRWQVPRRALYAFGLAAAAAAVVIVPKFVGDRPPNGYVTGNEAMQQPGGTQMPASGSKDLASVSDAEMEKVVEANPKVAGMRLALAGRYTREGRYDLATVHYTEVLKQDPNNAEAQAHMGWILLQLDRPKEAGRFVDAAVRNDPKLFDALWFQANIRLYGLRDPAGAIQTLDTMRARRDLTPGVRRQVVRLRKAALDSLEARR